MRIFEIYAPANLVEGATIIQEAETGAQLSIMQFTLASDCLLCNLTLATATRPSALNNVLISDYGLF